MAPPIVVAAGADQVVPFSGIPTTVNLTATASGGNGGTYTFQWTMKAVPPGSTADVGVNKDFTDGVSFLQNPDFDTDASVDGGYVLECIASDASGASNPDNDKGAAQQNTIVETDALMLQIPDKFQYDWDQHVNTSLRLLEAAVGAGVTVHAIGGASHSASTIATFNALISDGNFDDDGDPRPPTAHTHAHADATGQTADDHHDEAHSIASHNDTTATGAELETLTDGSDADSLHGHDHSNLAGVGTDDHHAESHTIASHSDTGATGAELEELTDGSETTLHTHAGGGGTADALSTSGADVDVSAAAPPTTGQVLKATGATAATWQNESGGGGGGSASAAAVGETDAAGIATLLEIDFTAEATQDLTSGGDGAKTIAGKTFYADNTAGATKMAVTNGVGLELDAGASALFGNTSRTAPVVGIRLPDIRAGLNFHDIPFIRTWMIFSDNADENFEQTTLAFERKHAGAFAGATWHYWRGEKLFNGSALFGGDVNINGVQNSTPTSSDNLSDDVVMVKLYSTGNAEVYSGVSVSGDFPATSDMRLRSNIIVPDDVAMRFDSAAEMATAISAVTANGSGNFEATITKMKVDASGLPPIREPGMQAVLDIDFTTEETQDLTSGGDGDKTIAGKTFYVDNTANASKLAVTNGVGLEIDNDTTNTELVGVTRTAPIFGIRLTDLDIDYQDMPFMRVWAVLTDNVDADFERSVIGFERKQIGGFSSGTYHHWTGFRNFNSNLRFDALITKNGVNSGQDNTQDNTSDDVMMIEFDPRVGHASFYTGVSVGGGFPDVSVMRRRNLIGAIGSGGDAVRFDAASEMAAILASVSSNASGNLETTWTRLKVEVPSNAVSATKTTPDSYERQVTAAVLGTDTTEYTTGRSNFNGSIIGLSAQIQDAVTAGTVVATVKVGGVAKFSVTLDTTNTEGIVKQTSAGSHIVAAGEEVSVDIISTGYTHSGGSTSGITVNVTLLNDTITAATPNLLSGPVILLDANFIAEPTQDLIAGGAFIVAGKTVYVDNVAGASKFTVTNGVGLEIDGNANNTTLSGSNRTSPMIGVRITDLGVSPSDLSWIRIWAMFTQNADQAIERSIIGFERKQVGGFSSGSYNNIQQHLRWNASLEHLALATLNGVQQTVLINTDELAHDVMMVQLDLRSWRATMSTGNSVGGDFPASSAMREWSIVDLMSSAEALEIILDPLSEAALFLAIATSNTNNNFETTWTRMKVDAK